MHPRDYLQRLFCCFCSSASLCRHSQPKFLRHWWQPTFLTRVGRLRLEIRVSFLKSQKREGAFKIHFEPIANCDFVIFDYFSADFLEECQDSLSCKGFHINGRGKCWLN